VLSRGRQLGGRSCSEGGRYQGERALYFDVWVVYGSFFWRLGTLAPAFGGVGVSSVDIGGDSSDAHVVELAHQMEARAMTTGAVPTPAVGDCSGKHSEAVPAAATSRAVVVLSSGIAVLALLASLGGLLMDGVYGEPASVAEMLRGYDLVTVVIVAPGLLVSQLLAGRKSDRWKLLSIGLLAYLIYTYA
jgi:hypothetical protein